MEYLFYRLWQLLIGKSEKDMPPFSSTMMITLFEFSNIVTILSLINHFFDISFQINDENEAKLFASSISVPLLVFNIFFLFRRRQIIKQKFENESISKKKVGNILVIIYAIVSVLTVFIFGSMYPINK